MSREVIEWFNIKEKEPEDGQEVLTTMKHGIISGIWSAQDRVCRGYYWTDLEWRPHMWAAI